MSRKNHEDALETKQSILNSALRLFSRRGFERTSLSDIAKYAGVTRGAIYWHFENKEDLFYELLLSISKEKLYDNLVDEASKYQEKKPLAKLKESLMALANDNSVKFFNSAMITIIDSIIDGKSGGEDLKKRLVEYINQRRNQLKLLLKNAVAKGQLPQNLALELASIHIFTFIGGYVHQVRNGNSEELRKNFEFMVDLLIADLPKITTDKTVS